MEEERLASGLANAIKAFFSAAGKKKAVLGLSGGIDSALVAALLAKGLGKENVCALYLPFSKSTPEENRGLALALVETLGIELIEQSVDGLVEAASGFPWEQGREAKANSIARARMLALYNYANSKGALVAGTGNRTELVLGYFTKFGDGACDVLPIGSLWKTQVRRLANALGLPQEIISKAPSAELWPGQTDEGELGMAYEEMDSMLGLLLDKGKSRDELVAAGYGQEKVEALLARISGNAHKLRMPAVLAPE